MGAFLDEGDDLSREEMKNRQNAALTSISSAAGARDRRGADLIETAAEVDLLCGGEGLLLSPGGAAACGIELCASPLASGGGGGRDGTPNGDTASCSRLSPSSSAMLLLSPVSDLTLEFEHMSLGGSAGGGGVRERRSSGGGRHRELRDSSSSSSSPPAPLAAAQLSCGLGRLSLGRAEDEGQPAGGKRCSGGSSSSEEFLEAQENLDGPLGQRTRGADSGRTLCARSKSWDHGGRDLSSSGSSGSYKSFNSSNEFLSRTPPPPRIRKSLFIEGWVSCSLAPHHIITPLFFVSSFELCCVPPTFFPGMFPPSWTARSC